MYAGSMAGADGENAKALHASDGKTAIRQTEVHCYEAHGIRPQQSR